MGGGKRIKDKELRLSDFAFMLEMVLELQMGVMDCEGTAQKEVPSEGSKISIFPLFLHSGTPPVFDFAQTFKMN